MYTVVHSQCTKVEELLTAAKNKKKSGNGCKRKPEIKTEMFEKQFSLCNSLTHDSCLMVHMLYDFLHTNHKTIEFKGYSLYI